MGLTAQKSDRGPDLDEGALWPGAVSAKVRPAGANPAELDEGFVVGRETGVIAGELLVILGQARRPLVEPTDLLRQAFDQFDLSLLLPLVLRGQRGQRLG